jgi:phospholipid/cholesterol/gamma-HCH transport system ATP-binding protein
MMTSQDEKFIQFIHTSKSFNGVVVHKDINMIIPKGKITYIIGPSGTGKSVFIKQVMGLLKPDTGQILVDGKNVLNLTELENLQLRKRFGLLFQNAALFDSMNVYENVSFPLREHTLMTEAEIKRLVHSKLLQVGLKDIDNKMPSDLSGGMRKRVGLARALALEPEVMLYDEPTTGLDPIMTDVVDDLIYSTQNMRPGRTTVVISHDIKSTLKMADSIAMIYKGVVLQGSVEFFKTTDDPVVRQFFSGSKDGPIGVY